MVNAMSKKTTSQAKVKLKNWSASFFLPSRYSINGFPKIKAPEIEAEMTKRRRNATGAMMAGSGLSPNSFPTINIKNATNEI